MEGFEFMRYKRITKFLAAALAVVMLTPTVSEAFGDLILDATTESIEVATSAATNVDYRCSFLDTTTTATTPGNSDDQITTATDTTIVAAPAASTQRKVSGCDLVNTSTTTSNTLTVQFDTSGTERIVYQAVLQPRWALHWSEGRGWSITDQNGRDVTEAPIPTSYGGRSFYYYKRGTQIEAAGLRYSWMKDVGIPGAWVPGTPGLNGDALSCDTTADATIAGAHLFPDPSAGAWYLVGGNLASTLIGQLKYIDLLWYNTGITVTTTTAQSITHPGIPARDVNGTSNGEGVYVGLLATAAIGGGAVTNTTLSYTDQDGNTGNTATMASWNATSVVGTWVEFELASGDTGIRSVESITLGTTYTSGSLSLIQYRPIVDLSATVANSGTVLGWPSASYITDPGIRLWNDSCLTFVSGPMSNTTATNINGTMLVVER